ncbi:MAG: FkbM family methyltransferase [Planctomycetaceae bacterium]|jgi:FkbM family methyltransferase|nr:FkbM family methyltransferase [Planctomycetaceae bacterium]
MNIQSLRIIFRYVLKHIKSRFDGTMIRRLRSLRRAKNILEQLNPDKNTLESWLVEVIDADLKFYKSTLLIADKLWFFFESPLIKWFLRKEQIRQNELYDKLETIFLSPEKDRIILKDIQLPRANETEKYLFIGEIIEILILYLIQNPELIENLFGKDIECEGLYEPNEHIQLKSGDIVIDAGANAGLFSALGSAKGCYVYAFEPIPYMRENYLVKIAAWNRNITVCPFALWDKEEELTFSVSRVNPHSASAARNTGYKMIDQVTVHALSLDEFVRQNNIPRIDFIKADIEGAERHLLMGAKNVLKEFAPKLSICTYHLPDDPLVIRRLIQESNTNYTIIEGANKIYAYCPDKK